MTTPSHSALADKMGEVRYNALKHLVESLGMTLVEPRRHRRRRRRRRAAGRLQAVRRRMVRRRPIRLRSPWPGQVEKMTSTRSGRFWFRDLFDPQKGRCHSTKHETTTCSVSTRVHE